MRGALSKPVGPDSSGWAGTLVLVRDLFGVPWESLTLDGVRAFLADAGDEGVTWEAKADEDGKGRLHRARSRRRRAASRTSWAATS